MSRELDRLRRMEDAIIAAATASGWTHLHCGVDMSDQAAGHVAGILKRLWCPTCRSTGLVACGLPSNGPEPCPDCASDIIRLQAEIDRLRSEPGRAPASVTNLETWRTA